MYGRGFKITALNNWEKKGNCDSVWNVQGAILPVHHSSRRTIGEHYSRSK